MKQRRSRVTLHSLALEFYARTKATSRGKVKLIQPFVSTYATNMRSARYRVGQAREVIDLWVRAVLDTTFNYAVGHI